MTRPIDQTGLPAAIAALVRNKAEQKDRASSAKGRDAAARSSANPQRSHRPSLQQVIGVKAKHLDPDQPDFRSKLMRVVVESALLQELGEGLITSPKFQAMVDDVLHAMLSSPSLQDDISDIVSQFKRGPLE